MSYCPQLYDPPPADRSIAEARREATARKSSRPFIDKRPSRTAAGPYHGHSDEVLFRAYQDGDDAAFLALYERYKANVYAYCAQAILSAGLPREVVDDTFQDIFLRL